jgi:hypothetical protein
MGRAVNRWKDIGAARRRGDTAAFWAGLMSSIGWAFVALIALTALVMFVIRVV